MEVLPEIRREKNEKAEVKSFRNPKEIRNFPKGHMELIEVGGKTISKSTFEPGWRWSESVQPIVSTSSCDAPHFQYHVSGVMMFRMKNGETYECREGDVSVLPAGHDVWVVGDDPVVVIDFQGMIDKKIYR